MLDYKYIEQLIERYFDCETTLEEERVLRAFFSQDITKVPMHLLCYRQLFLEQQMSKQDETLGEDFDNRILAIIGETAEADTNKVKARKVSLNSRLRPLYKAAASVAVVLAIGQAAQMPYSNEEQEKQQEVARSIEMLEQMKQYRNTVAQTDTAQAAMQTNVNSDTKQN